MVPRVGLRPPQRFCEWSTPQSGFQVRRITVSPVPEQKKQVRWAVPPHMPQTRRPVPWQCSQTCSERPSPPQEGQTSPPALATAPTALAAHHHDGAPSAHPAGAGSIRTRLAGLMAGAAAGTAGPGLLLPAGQGRSARQHGEQGQQGQGHPQPGGCPEVHVVLLKGRGFTGVGARFPGGCPPLSRRRTISSGSFQDLHEPRVHGLRASLKDSPSSSLRQEP